MGRPYKMQPYAIFKDGPKVDARRDLTTRRRVATGWFTRFADAVARVLGKKEGNGE
jgi:hypothetical protein